MHKTLGCVRREAVELPSGGELCVSPHVWEAAVVYVRGARSGLLSISAQLFWPAGWKPSSCGATAPWRKMKPLTHRVICRRHSWDSEQLATEQRQKLELAADLKWGHGICPQHTLERTHNRHMSVRRKTDVQGIAVNEGGLQKGVAYRIA